MPSLKSLLLMGAAIALAAMPALACMSDQSDNEIAEGKVSDRYSPRCCWSPRTTLHSDLGVPGMSDGE